MIALAHVGPVPVEELAFAAPALLLALPLLRARLRERRVLWRDGRARRRPDDR